MKHTVVKELESSIKVTKIFTLFDLVFVIAFFILSNIFSFMVNEKIKVLYNIYNILLPLYLVMPCPFNKNRKIYQSFIEYLRKDKITYSAIKENINE